MPTVQEGNFTNPIRTPGYWDFFSGGTSHRSGAAMADFDRKTLPATRSVNPALDHRTTTYTTVGQAPSYTPKWKTMNERRAKVFDRSVGHPSYNTFNCIDRDEPHAVTAAEDRDSRRELHKRAGVLRDIVNGPSHFPTPVPTDNMYTQCNLEPWKSHVLPLPVEKTIAKNLYKTWWDLKPKFSRSEGLIYHNHWGVQDGVGLLSYRKKQEDDKKMYCDQEEYRRLVEDRRKTGGRVLSVMGVDYHNPRSEFYRPLYMKEDVNPVQKQHSHMYGHKDYIVRPLIPEVYL